MLEMLTGQRSSILVFALVIASMCALLSASMYTSVSPKEKLIEGLQAARTNVNLARMINPENICFTLDNETLGKYSPALAQAINFADIRTEDEIRRNEHHGNYYTGTAVSLDRSQILSLLRAYNFNQTRVSHDPSTDRFFTYEDRNFSCGFNYSDKHYLLTLFFTTLEQVNTERGHVPIHISQSLVEKAEHPLNNVTTFAPFNNTAVFFNELSSPVTIEVSSKNGGITYTITLLPNKMQDVRLSPNWTRLENTGYHYKVKEYPWIEGDISVSPRYNSECMSKEIAKSLYLQSDFDVKFPAYLPEGFKPVCNAENLPSYVIQIYVNQTAVDNYRKSGAMSSRDNPYPFYLYPGMPEEQVEGIVQVHAQKYYAPTENQRDTGFSAYQSMLNDTAANIGYRTNPQFFNDRDGANSTSYLTYNEGKFLSVVNVLTSDESYRVVGTLPMEEVMKIAKSLS